MNPIVLNDQPGKFSVVDLFSSFGQTHALDLLSNVIESLGEVSEAGNIVQIDRIEAVQDRKNSVV